MADDRMRMAAQRRGRRTSVSAEVFNSMAQQAAQTAAGGNTAEPARRRTQDMSPEMRSRALEEMSKNLLFNSIREAERLRIVDSMFDVEKHAGEDVITQGDDGDNFYIIDRGILEVFLQGVQGPVKRYEHEGSFGELALMYSQPRAATVRAKGDCLLWAMSRHTYQHMMRASEQAKRSEIQGFLERVPLFGSLQDEEGSHQLASLTDLCVDDGAQRTYGPGDCICKQGEEGDEFFILKTGTAQAHVTGVGKVRDYQAGDYFGEKALMNDSGRRAATIVATSAAQCLVVPGRDFKNLLGSLDEELTQRQQEYEQALTGVDASVPRAVEGMPLQFVDTNGIGPMQARTGYTPPAEDSSPTVSWAAPPSSDEEQSEHQEALAPLPDPVRSTYQRRGRRTSVSAEVFNSMAQQAAQTAAGGNTAEPARRRTQDMSPEMRSRALEEMSKNLLFNSIREAERLRIVDSMFDVEKHAGEDVITQGDDGDNFYIIDRGILEVFLQGVQGPVKRYEHEGSFGELALMYSQPRAATVRAKGDCLLWAMSRHTYQHMMRASEQAKRSEIQGFLERVPLFGSLQDEEGSHQLASLTDLCVDDGAQRTYGPGDCICKQGEEGDEFFILKTGTAQAHVTGVGKVRDYQAGDYFGEKALMNDSGRRTATIVATSAAQCLVVPGRDFKNLLGSLDEELTQRQQEYEQALTGVDASVPRAVEGISLHEVDRSGQQRNSAEPRITGHQHPDVTEEDIAIADLFEAGLILKMVGARASSSTAAGAEAFLFQLAVLRNQLVLRWSDIRSRQAVGCVALARIAHIDFDRQRLEVMLSSGRHVPIVLIASREADFQSLSRALQHLHSGGTVKESTGSDAQESKRIITAMDREIAELESELQPDDLRHRSMGSTTHAGYIGGNRVNRWGELTGDANMPTQRAPATDVTVRPGSEDATETAASRVEAEAALANANTEAEAAIAHAKAQAANAVARAEAEIAAAKASAEAAAAAARADADATITKAKAEADSAEAESAFALVIARAEAEAASAEVTAEAEAASARARVQMETEIAIARARAEAEAEAIIARAKAEAEATTIRARAEAEAAQTAAKARADAAAATAQSEAAAASRAKFEASQALADAQAARDKAAQADSARIEAARMEAEMSKSAQIEASRVEVAKVEAAQMQAHFARAQQEAAEVRAQMEAQHLALENHKAELEGQRRAIMEEEQAAIQRAKAASDAHISEQLKRHESEVARQREALLAEKKKVASELRAAQEASYLRASVPEPEPEAQVARNSGAREPTAHRMPEAVQRALIRVIADAISRRRSVFGVQCRDVRSFFRAVDRDGNGWLSLEELQDAMSRMDMGLVDEQIRLLVNTIDTDSDGRVTFSEFEKWMRSEDQEAVKLQAQQDESRLQWQAERQLDAGSTSSVEEQHSTAGVQRDGLLVSEAVPYASIHHEDTVRSLDRARPNNSARRAPKPIRKGPRRRMLHLVHGQGMFEILDRDDPQECQWFVSPDGSDKSDGRQPDQSVDGKKGPFATFKRCRRVIDAAQDQRRHVIYISAGSSEWERYVVGMSAPLHANIAGFLQQALTHCPPEVKDATLGQLIHRGVRTVHDLVAGPHRIHSAEDLAQMGLPTCAQEDLWQAVHNISHTQEVTVEEKQQHPLWGADPKIQAHHEKSMRVVTDWKKDLSGQHRKGISENKERSGTASVPFPARIGKYDPVKGVWTIEPRDKRTMNPHQGGTASVPFPPRIGKYNPIRAEWIIEPRDKSCMQPPKTGVGKVPFPPSIGKYDPLRHEWVIEPKDKRFLERTSKHHMLTRAKPFES